MKKYQKLGLMSGIILALFLTACSGNRDYDAENTSSAIRNEQDADENTGLENDGLGNNASENEANDQLQHSQSGILDKKEPLDAEGVLSQVPSTAVASGMGQSLAAHKNQLLVFGSAADLDDRAYFKISLLDMDTGNAVYEAEFEQLELPNVQVCGDSIAVTDWADGEVYLLDETLEIQCKYQTGTAYCGIYLNTDADCIYCFTKEGIVIADLSDAGESISEDTDVQVLSENMDTQKLPRETKDLLVNSRCGQKVIVSYTDQDTQMTVYGSVDLDSKTYEKVPFEGALYSVARCDDLWLAGRLDDETLYYLGKDSSLEIFTVDEAVSVVTLLDEPMRILTTVFEQDGNAVRTLYDVDGTFVSQSSMIAAGSDFENGAVWSDADGGYYFIVTDTYGTDNLIFWDISISASGSDLEFTKE